MDDFTSLIKWLIIFIIGCILCYYKLSKNENFINKKLSKTEISNNVKGGSTKSEKVKLR